MSACGCPYFHPQRERRRIPFSGRPKQRLLCVHLSDGGRSDGWERLAPQRRFALIYRLVTRTISLRAFAGHAVRVPFTCRKLTSCPSALF